MYKIANGLSPDFMIELMTNLGNQCSTRSNGNVTVGEEENIICYNKSDFRLSNVQTIKFGLKLSRSIGLQLGKLVPAELSQPNLSMFSKQ